jgi:hypothetical protein
MWTGVRYDLLSAYVFRCKGARTIFEAGNMQVLRVRNCVDMAGCCRKVVSEFIGRLRDW